MNLSTKFDYGLAIVVKRTPSIFYLHCLQFVTPCIGWLSKLPASEECFRLSDHFDRYRVFQILLGLENPFFLIPNTSSCLKYQDKFIIHKILNLRRSAKLS